MARTGAPDALAQRSGAMHRVNETAVDIAVIAGVVLLVRAATLWTEVIDWDVGLYLVVAREILHGQLPYVTAWEIRPPGLFYLLAAALAIFRTPALAMGALGIVSVFATSVALYRTGRLFGEGARALGLIAGLLYAMTSIEDDGLATNTEILFAPFVCWAVYLVLRSSVDNTKPGLRRGLAIGALLAAALQIKLMVLPVSAFVVVLAALWAHGGRRLGLFVAGVAALPFVVEAALWDSQSQLGPYLDANVGSLLRRAATATSAPRDNLARILAQPLALAPASVLALLSPFGLAREGAGSASRRLVPVLGAWFAVEAFTLVIVREFNDHQFLTLLPPLALLGAFATVALTRRLAGRAWVAAAVAALAFVLHGYYQVVQGARLAYYRTIRHDASWHEANVDEIAARVRTAPGSLRTLFVVGETPVVYLLADAPLPTRLPFSLYLTDPEMWPLTGVNGVDEVARILEGRPALVLRSDSRFHVDPAVAALLDKALAEGYRPVATFQHDTLYQRSDLPPL